MRFHHVNHHELDHEIHHVFYHEILSWNTIVLDVDLQSLTRQNKNPWEKISHSTYGLFTGTPPHYVMEKIT